MGIAEDIAIIVICALACAIIAQRLKLPIMLGYIFAGVLLGPHTLGPTVGNINDVEVLADIGIALLLFTVGLEFPIERLSSVKHIAIIGTPLQMALCIGFGYIVGWVFNWPSSSSLWFGCLISVSSTMVVLKVLSDRGLSGTLSSRVMTAILIVQDLMVIPMVILLPKLKELSTAFGSMVGDLLISLFVAAIVVVVSARWMPKLVSRVATMRSRELFMVTVLALGLGLGYITYKIGLSLAFGAFLAGIILSRCDYSHQVLNEIIPLRDLFSLIFIVSVGLMLEPEFITNHWHEVLLLLIIVALGKSLIMGLTTRLFGYVNIMPLAVGLYMFPIGEFAFVLARTGKSSGALDNDLYLLIVTIAAISMSLTPMLSSIVGPIYKAWRKFVPATGTSDATSVASSAPTPIETTSDHFVVVGYGRIGHTIGSVLRARNSNVIIIEANSQRIQEAKDDGFKVIGGDAYSDTIMDAVHIDTARLVIITIPSRSESTLILRKIHRNYPQAKVILRALDQEHMRELLAYGAATAVVPESEAGLALIRSAMLMSAFSTADADLLIDYIRREGYDPLVEEFEELQLNDKGEIIIHNNKTNTDHVIDFRQDLHPA